MRMQVLFSIASADQTFCHISLDSLIIVIMGINLTNITLNAAPIIYGSGVTTGCTLALDWLDVYTLSRDIDETRGEIIY